MTNSLCPYYIYILHNTYTVTRYLDGQNFKLYIIILYIIYSMLES